MAIGTIGSIPGDNPWQSGTDSGKGSVQQQLDALDARVTALEGGEAGENEPEAEDAIAAQGVTGK